MEYNILGISIHKRIAITTGEPPKEMIEGQLFKVFVAWQSNNRGCPFCWRCTTQTVNHLPTLADAQRCAATGEDERDTKLVRKLFPYLPPTRLTD